jgi:hypothetical protein
MGIDRRGTATCRHCGATIHLITIFPRAMNGFAKVWRRRHEAGCADRTPAQRRAWATRPRQSEAIEINYDHPGMMETPHG